jgi:hypothetical protein
MVNPFRGIRFALWGADTFRAIGSQPDSLRLGNGDTLDAIAKAIFGLGYSDEKEPGAIS